MIAWTIHSRQRQLVCHELECFLVTGICVFLMSFIGAKQRLIHSTKEHQFEKIKAAAQYEWKENLASLVYNNQAWTTVVRRVGPQPANGEALFVKKEYRIANPTETSKRYKYLRSEYQILRQLRHPHIVKYVDFEQKWKNGTLKTALYMEYCSGGDLTHYAKVHHGTKTISEDQFWQIFAQLVSALLYCHTGLRHSKERHGYSLKKDREWERAVLHRDIKPSNGLTAPIS